MCHRVLCYGDSNTYGYDPRSYLGGRYPASVRWTGLLRGAGWEIINEGENGRSIPRSEREFEAVARAARRTEADALTVMLGSNDLLQQPGLSAEACAGRMEAFLSAVGEAAPANIRILLIAPPPMEPGTWVSENWLLEESRRLADSYRELARRLGTGYANAGDWHVGLTFDGVHFSEAGHRIFAGRIAEALAALLQKREAAPGGKAPAPADR